jgi:hypothetical protein
VTVVPSITIVVPLEGTTNAYLQCSGYEEERRLALDVRDRDLLSEIVDALVRLFDALDDRQGDTA